MTMQQAFILNQAYRLFGMILVDYWTFQIVSRLLVDFTMAYASVTFIRFLVYINLLFRQIVGIGSLNCAE
jgi:hypothetical protein